EEKAMETSINEALSQGFIQPSMSPWRLAFSFVAPSVFQAFINDTLRKYLGNYVIMYIDDILKYSRDLESHIRHIRSALKKLLDNGLYVKGEKCEFHLTTTTFLGYIISQGGITMDDRKIESNLTWPTPTTIKKLQSFLGFAYFYQCFIRNFSSIAAPLKPS
ncbi:hypothetical protein P4O66_012665, partial [Electrophorus voltai]